MSHIIPFFLRRTKRRSRFQPIRRRSPISFSNQKFIKRNIRHYNVPNNNFYQAPIYHSGHIHGYQEPFHSTTVLSVRKNKRVVMIADGQITQGATIVKGSAKKLRNIDNKILVGMAGSVGDCLTLIEILQEHLQKHPQLVMACVSFVKAWRREKYLRQFQAQLCVADRETSLLVNGNGDVIEQDDGILAIGSGGIYAYACAKGLIDIDGLNARQIAEKSMKVASDMCVYTNNNFVIEELI